MSDLIIEASNIPPFQISSKPGFICNVPKITIDLHETKNASDNFALPQFYLDFVNQKNPGSMTVNPPPTWEGVYIPSIQMTIPRKFLENGKPTQTFITINDVVIDNNGITAIALATKVIEYEKDKAGDMNGFKFSIDSIRVNVIASTLSKAGVYGDMNIPINKNDDDATKVSSGALAYGLTITNDPIEGLSYAGYGKFDPAKALTVEAFDKATMTLSAAELHFVLKRQRFYPKAILSGYIVLSGSKKPKTATAGTAVSDPSKEGSATFGLSFNKLIIEANPPYLSLAPGGMVDVKLGDKSSKTADNTKSAINNLPIQIKRVTFLTSEDGKTGFGVELAVLLQGSKEGNESGNGFQANTFCKIWTKRDVTTKRYKYEGFELESLSIKVKQGAFSLDGTLNMFEQDKVYGKGFCGSLKVEIIDKFKVDAAAIFGKTVTNIPESTSTTASTDVTKASAEEDNANSYRYWFVDFQATFGGVTFAPGVDLNSISGGLYKNMVMSLPKATPLAQSGVVCKSITGKEFTPSEGIFGVMAGIGIQSSGGGQAYNGRINFGVEFNIGINGGGIRKIATWGDVKVMSDLPKVDLPDLSLKAALAAPKTNSEQLPTKEATQKDAPSTGEDESEFTSASNTPKVTVAPLMLDWFVVYDFPNKTLVGDFNVYINLPGMKGDQTKNKAGNISLFSSPSYWYLYIGQPKPNLMVGVSIFNAVKLGAYMCIGSKLPDPPIAAMPDEFKGIALKPSDMLGLGSGFSLGGRLTIGDKGDFAIFSYDYSVQSGFDLLVARSLEVVNCEGEVRGVKNWYALGQAFILGKASAKALGIRIASIALGAGIAGGGPKPTFVKGVAFASVRVLRKDREFKAKVKFGKNCEVTEDISDLEFIAGNYPDNNQLDVSVFTTISVTFKNELENFEFSYMSGNSQGTYRANTNEGSISLKANGIDIPFKLVFNESKSSVLIVPLEILPEKASITVNCSVFFQKKSQERWGVDNKLKGTTRTFTFTTDAEPLTISPENVSYSYPYAAMGNFYKSESKKGYVKLDVVPKKAVELKPGEEFLVASYNANNQLIEKTNQITINTTPGQNLFEYDIPLANLEPQKSYELRIVKAVIGSNSTQNTGVIGNVGSGTTKVIASDFDILKLPFTTSEYFTFKEKINSYKSSNSTFTTGYLEAYYLAKNGESLTDLELYGDHYIQPLLQIGKVNYTNSSITDQINGLSATVAGISTTDAVNISSVKDGIGIVSNQINTFKDFLEDQNARCLQQGNCTAKDVSKAILPAGKVSVPINYYLPGKTIPNSSATLEVNLNRSIKL